MKSGKVIKKIGLIGGGPAALFMYKQFVDAQLQNFEITIYEKEDTLGAGLPYSRLGAGEEHITNVSANEIPGMVTSMEEWLEHESPVMLDKYDIDRKDFNEYKVLPRLLFGRYLTNQFARLYKNAQSAGIKTRISNNTLVTDIEFVKDKAMLKVTTATGEQDWYDSIVICTGHTWPEKFEGQVPGWFDSPYPPAKLEQQIDFPVAIKGSSLTAIDAVRTLARANGNFIKKENGEVCYQLKKASAGFKMVMHSLGGFLPGLRFHLEDTHLSPDSPITEEELRSVKKINDGFLPLDYIFERNFKQPLHKQDPAFYEEIKEMNMEAFVDHMMALRERLDPFILLKAEYAEAEKSILRRSSVSWKEMLAVLSYAMNYPAKHLSAEDMIRLRKTLMPLISIVIAFVPQQSVLELLAVYDAGVLSLIPVSKDSTIIPGKDGGAWYNYTDEEENKQNTYYQVFVDAVGQPPLMYDDIPFEGLKLKRTISPAYLRFRFAESPEKEIELGNKQVSSDGKGNYYLQVSGISINDDFQVLDRYGVANRHIYIMAVPYIGGLNPDYSGLDFCETASAVIFKAMQESYHL